MKIILLNLLLFFLTAPASVLPPNGLQDEPNNEKEVELFNGEDLTGWHGNMEYWRAENGMIVGEISELPASQSIYYNKVVEVLRLILNEPTEKGERKRTTQNFKHEAIPKDVV